MTDISASADNIEMLRSVRDRLFDAFRDGDCPVRELSALSRRLQEVGGEIAAYGNTPESWQKHLDDLGYLQAHMAAAVNRPDCPYRELSPLTRRLQDIVKDIAATQQKLKLVESKVRKRSNGRTNLATTTAGTFDATKL